MILLCFWKLQMCAAVLQVMANFSLFKWMLSDTNVIIATRVHQWNNLGLQTLNPGLTLTLIVCFRETYHLEIWVQFCEPVDIERLLLSILATSFLGRCSSTRISKTLIATACSLSPKYVTQCKEACPQRQKLWSSILCDLSLTHHTKTSFFSFPL